MNKILKREYYRTIVERLLFVSQSKFVWMFLLFLVSISTFADPITKHSNTDTIKRNDITQTYGFKDLFVVDVDDHTAIYNTKLNPQAVSFVQDYIRQQGHELEQMKGWGQPYFDLIESVLTQYGLPKELKYLAVIESHLQSKLVSWVGARGPWQLMPETARQMGLVVTKYTDERTDYYKSTHAAAKYLKMLYNQLGGDWLLVIAAYNGGPGRVLSAIKRSGSKNFWDLQYDLPTESRNHVKKFIGTHYIFEGRGGETTLTAQELTQARALQNTALTLAPQRNIDNVTGTGGMKVESVMGKFNSVVIAKNLLIDLAEFNRLNPGFDKAMSNGQSYNLTLPEEKMTVFFAQKNIILNESVQALLSGNTTL